MTADNELLYLLKTNPQKGLKILMNTYSGLVYAIVCNRLSGVCSAEDIEECVSDMFYEFYKNIDRVDLQKGSIKAFLSVIGKRKSIDVFRRAKNINAQTVSFDDLFYEDKDANTQSDIIKSQEKAELIKEIKALGEPDAEIFIRKYYLYQSTKQISKDLKLKENTIDKKVSRGLAKLKEALGGE